MSNCFFCNPFKAVAALVRGHGQERTESSPQRGALARRRLARRRKKTSSGSGRCMALEWLAPSQSRRSTPRQRSAASREVLSLVEAPAPQRAVRTPQKITIRSHSAAGRKTAASTDDSGDDDPPAASGRRHTQLRHLGLERAYSSWIRGPPSAVLGLRAAGRRYGPPATT